MKFLTGILCVSLALCFASVQCFGQDTTRHIETHLHPPPLPLLPQFPGGKAALASFIKKHTRYPDDARKHNISGTIEVDFVVTTTGEIKDIHVFKSLGYGCDEEAIRVVKKMPKWEPGRVGRVTMELDNHVNIPFGTISDSLTNKH